jgi:hypothetical protein
MYGNYYDIKLRPYVNISSTIHKYSEKICPGVHMVILGQVKHGGGSGGADGEIFGAGSESF